MLIRKAGLDDLDGWIAAMRTAYLRPAEYAMPDGVRAWWHRCWDSDRVRGAWDGDRCVATLRTFPAFVTVPGGAGREVAADALTQVSVAATHRRRGLLTTMLTDSLHEARQRGEAISVLRSAEWPIYGRFGYGVATQTADYRVMTYPKPVLVAPSEQVTVRSVTLQELAGPARALFDRFRWQRPGQLTRDEPYWQRHLGLDGARSPDMQEPYAVLATSRTDEPLGYALWEPRKGDWFEERVDLSLRELVAPSSDAYRALWGYLLAIDLTRSVYAEEFPIDEPLEWLLDDGRAARRDTVRDSLWLRILDVPAALSARRYPVADRLVLRVVDNDAGGWGAGIYTLDGSPVHAECVPTPDATPDVTLSQRALAACYLGTTTLRSQEFAGLVTEDVPGGAARLGAMLRGDVAAGNITPF